MKDGREEKIRKLDFLRAISAAIVVAYHGGSEKIHAGFGVLTFFVISGFLITHLLLRENQNTETIAIRDFYIRRSLRIFPAFYVYFIIAITALLVHHSHILWPQAICAFFYVSNYYQGLHGYPSTLFSHTWSLGVEEQFYILWPCLFLLGRRALPRLTVVLLCVIPALWLYRAAIHFAGVPESYIYTAFETRVDSILVGCLLAIVLFIKPSPAFITEIRRSRYLPMSLLLLASSLYLDGRFGIGYRNVVGFAIDPVLLAILISQLIAWDGGGWMDSKAISYLGRISYSTYLYQQLLLPIVKPRLPPGLQLLGCFLSIWLVSAISYEIIEKPFIRIGHRFRHRAARSKPEAPHLADG